MGCMPCYEFYYYLLINYYPVDLAAPIMKLTLFVLQYNRQDDVDNDGDF